MTTTTSTRTPCPATDPDPATRPPSVPSATATAGALGTVVPVVGGHPGSGASGVCLALADAAAAAGLRVLLVDGADPARSGLAAVTDRQLRADPPRPGGHRVVTACRGQVVVRRLTDARRAVRPEQMPTVGRWAPPDVFAGGAFDVTVVDVGWDPWPLFGDVSQRPLGWLTWPRLTPGGGGSLPLLVTRASRPSLALTGGVLAQWLHAHTAGAVSAEPLLVVADAPGPQWLPAVAGLVDGPVRARLDTAVAFPHDPGARVDGWTDRPTSVAGCAAAGRVWARAPTPVATVFGQPDVTAPAERRRRGRRFRPTLERTVS